MGIDKCCKNCSRNENGKCFMDCTNFGYWKPKEPVPQKLCSTCLHNVDKPVIKCGDCYTLPDKPNWHPQDEIVTNANGGRQSKSKHLWLDFCPKALLKVAALSCAGNEKYGAGNWRKISAEEHINHAINHLMLWLAKDTSEDHLTHAAWRVLSALGVSLT